MKRSCRHCYGTGKITPPRILYICTMGISGFFKFKCKKCNGTGFYRMYSKGI